jgi:hypothetical protein
MKTAPAPDLSVKAYVVRGFISELKRVNLFEQVITRIEPATRLYMLEPSPGSTWVDSKHAEQIGEVVSELVGLQGWRKISHDATIHNMIPVLRVVIEGFVRIFGATPASLLTRLTKITSSSARGIEYDYQPISSRTGVLTVRYPERRNVPLSTFFCCAGGVETIFDICHQPGTLGDPKIVGDGLGNAARMDVKW